MNEPQFVVSIIWLVCIIACGLIVALWLAFRANDRRKAWFEDYTKLRRRYKL